MQPFTTLVSRVVVLPREDVDTDQIIPARFLTTTARTGLGAHLFADWRRDAAGNARADSPFDGPAAAGARILVAGRNFGCGSSREHAPWALLDHGFRAVVSPGFADIFRNNAITNGLLPVELDPDTHAALVAAATAAPALEVTIDLACQTVHFPPATVATFPIDAFARRCLLAGTDALGFLLAERPAIARYEQAHPPRIHTA